MNFFTNSGLTCRFCHHYDPIGRRGGNCQKLQALVEATWEACSLAVPAFDREWETPAEVANTYSTQVANRVNHRVAQQEEQCRQLIEETLLERNSLKKGDRKIAQEEQYIQAIEEVLMEHNSLAFVRLKQDS
ncbi:hypothetical protein [Pseudanabaena sp. PCC 6802]|uniref:hypothetical protein n=1 Tax=Pseudanabaena sp. PCC 6802 TaxID=118173 RepID=UPI000344A9CB|nr:hypothetical protein [Pseudanabaena sp. PCC 6802]